jgi:hypothetical protein
MRTYDLTPDEHLLRLATFLEFQTGELVTKLFANSCSNTAASITAKADVLIRELRERAELISQK